MKTIAKKSSLVKFEVMAIISSYGIETPVIQVTGGLNASAKYAAVYQLAARLYRLDSDGLTDMLRTCAVCPDLDNYRLVLEPCAGADLDKLLVLLRGLARMVRDGK